MRQPVALSGLFFMFLAVMTLVGMVPVIGLALALAVLPACTLGLMAASKEAMTGKFPMPTVFLSAFRAGRQQLAQYHVSLVGMKFAPLEHDRQQQRFGLAVVGQQRRYQGDVPGRAVLGAAGAALPVERTAEGVVEQILQPGGRGRRRFRRRCASWPGPPARGPSADCR